MAFIGSSKQSDEMKVKNSCMGRQRSGAELSIHIFHLRLETRGLYKNTVFHSASVRKEDTETDTSLHFALLQSPSSRSLDHHSYYCQWEQVNSKWEWNAISPDACGKRRHISLTEDSSISTVVIMATEGTNVVCKQALAKHFRSTIRDGIDDSFGKQRELQSRRRFDGRNESELECNMGQYVAEQLLVALRFFFF